VFYFRLRNIGTAKDGVVLELDKGGTMRWVIKDRERSTSFVAPVMGGANAVALAPDVDEAQQFDSLDAARTFKDNLLRGQLAGQLASAWASQPPELIEIELGTPTWIVRFWAWGFGVLRVVAPVRWCLYVLNKLKTLKDGRDSLLDKVVAVWHSRPK
jgi:hypothetical protein